jgi:hypothetical protein
VAVDANRLGVDFPRAYEEVVSRGGRGLATGHRRAEGEHQDHRGDEGATYHGRKAMRAILLRPRPRPILSLVLLNAALAVPAYAQPRNVALEFMAPDANWADRSLAGGAFICIQAKTASGPSEDCFGFYVRKSGKALVGGPGVVDPEFNFAKTPPARFSQVKASTTFPITAARRQRLLSFIRSFDKDFSLTPANCIAFANGVAKLAGLKTPASTSLTPVQYLDALRRLNPS